MSPVTALFLAAMLAAPTPTPDASGPRVPDGAWGGRGVSLRISGSGAEIEFDCARGAITGPLRLDAQGRFDVAGTYERGYPGPARKGQVPKAEPARYRGRRAGPTLQFEVILDRAEQPIGPFSARLGGPSRIHACL